MKVSAKLFFVANALLLLIIILGAYLDYRGGRMDMLLHITITYLALVPPSTIYYLVKHSKMNPKKALAVMILIFSLCLLLSVSHMFLFGIASVYAVATEAAITIISMLICIPEVMVTRT